MRPFACGRFVSTRCCHSEKHRLMTIEVVFCHLTRTCLIANLKKHSYIKSNY